MVFKVNNIAARYIILEHNAYIKFTTSHTGLCIVKTYYRQVNNEGEIGPWLGILCT